MLKITKEKIARKAGCQSPSMNGQFMTTQRRLDDSGDKVAPHGVFTKIQKPQGHAITPQVVSRCTGWAYPVSACVRG